MIYKIDRNFSHLVKYTTMRSYTMPIAFKSYTSRSMKVYGAICVNPKGEVLLALGRKSNKWSFPKGHYKYGTESDIDCAKRELFEETGIVAPENYVSYHKLRGGAYFIFAIEDTQDIIIKDIREIVQAKWWPLTQLPINSNIDVSIFKTLMKNINTSNIIDFLDSQEARRKISTITQNIEIAATI